MKCFDVVMLIKEFEEEKIDYLSLVESIEEHIDGEEGCKKCAQLFNRIVHPGIDELVEEAGAAVAEEVSADVGVEQDAPVSPDLPADTGPRAQPYSADHNPLIAIAVSRAWERTRELGGSLSLGKIEPISKYLEVNVSEDGKEGILTAKFKVKDKQYNGGRYAVELKIQHETYESIILHKGAIGEDGIVEIEVRGLPVDLPDLPWDKDLVDVGLSLPEKGDKPLDNG